jgi:hypothetical protein
LANYQGVSHPWLKSAVEICLEHVASVKYTDAHTIAGAFCLVESVSGERDTKAIYDKLARELFEASFFCLATPVNTYGLPPLSFAPTPNSFLRPLFTDATINAHLDDLATKQQEDGGWPILWQPPGEMAHLEWRGQGTVGALSILRAYSRI